MKRLSLVLVGLFALALFAMADAPLATDNEPMYPIYTMANAPSSTSAADIGGLVYINDDGSVVPVLLDTSVQSYVDPM